MSKATRLKYLAIGVNVSLICLSLTILASLYLFSVNSSGSSNNNSDDQFKNSSESVVATNNSSRSLRHPGEGNSQQQQKSDDDDSANSKSLFAYLPSLLQSSINWLGNSVTSTGSSGGGGGGGDEEGASFEGATSLFTAGRPLIAVASLWYFLAITVAIAVGIEHLTLLICLSTIFGLIFSSSLAALIFSSLSSTLDSNLLLFDFWYGLLIAICFISALQLYTTAFLVYEIIMERRIERTHEYCLAKMVPTADVDDL
ncbi:hypothetical protein TYRP_000236 [Tyrophagus putrescentiae]|nr:hypothetical protein TYRP_000236 [Tyrophagus putrescentiae]